MNGLAGGRDSSLFSSQCVVAVPCVRGLLQRWINTAKTMLYKKIVVDTDDDADNYLISVL